MLGQQVFYLISKARTGIRDYVSNLIRKGPFADDTFYPPASWPHACIYICGLSAFVSYCQVVVDIGMYCICKSYLVAQIEQEGWGVTWKKSTM
jgi:hypothetical protein